ncbi:MAG: right-handed parallel beta-helix repeat-containing protein [Candidatus Omnitrophica bacterium]|nr:right-handed parallel beta-helix repeat-containing protein [Candidatus Omnitrophota bacterium]
MKKLILSGIFFLIVKFSFATTYYIDYEKGDDNNSGTVLEKAWKHCPFDKNAKGLAKSTKIKGGDVLLFKGGVVYYGCIEIDGRFTYGDKDNPIVLKGDGWGDKKAIIDGSEIIEGEWKKISNPEQCKGNPNWENIYYIELKKSYSFTQGFYEDDEFLWYSQEPNPYDPFFYDKISNFRVIPKGNQNVKQTRTSITDPRYFTQKESDFWNGAYVVLWRVPNITVIRKIMNYDPESSTIYHEDVGGDLYTDRDSYYSIINHISLIDSPGEFALDEEKKFLYLFPRGDIKTHKYKVRVRDAGIVANGVKNIVIEGFIIQNFVMGIRVYRSSDNVPVPENFIIRNNEVKKLKSDDWYGIQANGKNGIIEGNIISDCFRGVGILAGGENITIRKNYVKRTSRQGIWFMGAKNSIIEDNIVEGCKGTHANGISVYSNCENIIVRNNYVSDSNIPFTMENSKDLKIYNNIFDGGEKVGYVIAGWGGMKGNIYILNNAILGSNNDALLLSGECKIIFKNNITDGILWNCEERSHNIYTTEKAKNLKLLEGEKIETDLKKIFYEFEKKDYRLKENSPAIDSGIDLSEHFDIDKEQIKRPVGQRWDIGPYEYKKR